MRCRLLWNDSLHLLLLYGIKIFGRNYHYYQYYLSPLNTYSQIWNYPLNLDFPLPSPRYHLMSQDPSLRPQGQSNYCPGLHKRQSPIPELPLRVLISPLSLSLSPIFFSSKLNGLQSHHSPRFRVFLSFIFFISCLSIFLSHNLFLSFPDSFSSNVLG